MIELTRASDWQKRLIAYLAARTRVRFAYGSHDCVAFAAGAVEAMTGTRPAPDLTAYGSEAEGLAAAMAAGWGSAADWCDAHLPQVAASFARPGDLVLVDAAEGPALAVVQGAGAYVPRTVGFGIVALSTAVRGWRIG
ncbi:hypothetical protein RGUI_2778 [Rhodovulum sp. P5]|uniref:DUF6950 family protein n=1 Tax=Rhodovulum sp. P5 TaxID=1564506 RepID=UPI0009C2E98F|nr:hypothetical protein [Rhodovulum sp. P5]ARE40919.1 hypothetical protein RGUI_2778 [Rhodovulum sp. P5]